MEECKESGKIEPCATEKPESSPRIEESAGGEGNCADTDEDLNLESVMDVSGKVVELPLIDEGGHRSEAVEEVYVFKNEMNLIPKAVGTYKGLRTLKFFANELNLFPGEFKNVIELECLQVKVGMPGLSGLDFSKLKNLKELELCKVPSRHSNFPILSEIAGLNRLTRLSICHFSIRHLPPEIAYLSNLEHLDLSFNKIRKLPDEVTSLSLLISLKVSNNKLTELPRLSYLQRLEELDLSNNRLTSLGFLKLELMRNLQTLNLQNNQLHGCQIPSWICCNLEGNGKDPLNDESAEMDVYEGSSVAPSSQVIGSSSDNQCSATRREKGWKRRYNLQTKTRQEQALNCKKWKSDVASRSSSEKCLTCKVVDNNANVSPEGLSTVADVDLENKDILPESDVIVNSVTSPHKKLSAIKYSVNGCSCSADNSGGLQNEAEADGPENEIVDTLSDVVGLDQGSSSEGSITLLKSKRHSEKDLDNPKPTKTRRPTSDPYRLSCQYSEKSFCGVEDHLPDGFYDAGRHRPFMPLNSYEKNVHANSREVILLDRARDEELEAILLCARSLMSHFKQINSSFSESRDSTVDDLHIASLLALLVSDHFGGSDKSGVVQKTRKSVSGSNQKLPFVCTCATGISSNTDKAGNQDVEAVEDIAFLGICEKFLQNVKERRNSTIVPIGGLQFGVCRHRALLMKYLCDRMEPRIPCELVRGYLDFGPHAWNVIVVKRGDKFVRMIVDACHPHDIREESDLEYFCRYIPLSRMSPGMIGDDASPNCSFPSLSACDKIGEVASTSLIRCIVGSLDAVAKVRSIEVNGASVDEVRKFELCCIGEVRILSILNHPCIIDFFGHHISSKWTLTGEGAAEGRKLQSAILMEYIKGGSLKSYLETLSSEGDKHVSLHLVLSIARDVAFALTEIHSRQIIHRDIKSENVLIDLEKRRQDGSPTVKICDFDRAIPLDSPLHTCCIAHIGIPPPHICVGTPRWMAPEVFRAMDKPNHYGLEVDIWSFGCLLLELLTLQVPYYGLSDPEIHNHLQMGERPRLPDEMEALAELDTEQEGDSDHTLRFLVKLYHQCTGKNPADRPSAEKIYNMLLNHSISDIGSRSSEEE